MMTELMNRKERMRLLLLVLCAFGSTCATFSGAIAAIGNIAELHGPNRD